MAKKVATLNERLMPVEEQAAIAPRIDTESQKGRKPESQKRGDDTLVGLNFKVSASFRREFRQYCAARDLSLVSALDAAFQALKERDG